MCSTSLKPPPRMQDCPGASVGAMAGDARHRHSFRRGWALCRAGLGWGLLQEWFCVICRSEPISGMRQPEWEVTGGQWQETGPQDRQTGTPCPSIFEKLLLRTLSHVQKTPLERVSRRYTRRGQKMDSHAHLPSYFL